MSEKPTNPKDVVGIAKVPSSTRSALVDMEIGVAMMEGSCKYGRHNYRDVGVRASVYYDGTKRHLDAWWEGQDIDPDTCMPVIDPASGLPMRDPGTGELILDLTTGLNHITKAIASLYVLRDAMICKMYEDDRPPCLVDVGAFIADLNTRSAALLEKHKDKNPVHITQKLIDSRKEPK